MPPLSTKTLKRDLNVNPHILNIQEHHCLHTLPMSVQSNDLVSACPLDAILTKSARWCFFENDAMLTNYNILNIRFDGGAI